jgi:hypothetical protein
VIYDSLGEPFKERNGLGILEACVAWGKLKDEYTGLHLLGYAENTELASSPTRVSYELEVSGYRFRVDLVRQELWTVFTDVERAPELSDWAAFGSMVQRRQVSGREVLVLVIPDPEDYARNELAIEDISVDLENYQELRIGREWKVDGFAPIEDTD